MTTTQAYHLENRVSEYEDLLAQLDEASANGGPNQLFAQARDAINQLKRRSPTLSVGTIDDRTVRKFKLKPPQGPVRRVSSNGNDPGYLNWCLLYGDNKIDVFLDGVEIRNVDTADADLGFVTTLDTDAAERGEWPHLTQYGKVEIKITPVAKDYVPTTDAGMRPGER